MIEKINATVFNMPDKFSIAIYESGAVAIKPYTNFIEYDTLEEAIGDLEFVIKMLKGRLKL